MSKVIHKYKLAQGLGHTELMLPEDSVVIDIKVQHGIICMWALHDIEVSREVVFDFYGYATGQKIPSDHAMMACKTVHIPTGECLSLPIYVVHYFYSCRHQ